MGQYRNVIVLLLFAFSHLSCFESVLKRIEPTTCYVVNLTATSSYHSWNKVPSESNLNKVTSILTIPHNSDFPSCNKSKIRLNVTRFISSPLRNISRLTLLFLIEPNNKNIKIEAYHCAENILQLVSNFSVHLQLQNLLSFRTETKPQVQVHEFSCCDVPNPFDPCCVKGFVLNKNNTICVEIAKVNVTDDPITSGEVMLMEENEENCNCKPKPAPLSLGVIIAITAAIMVFIFAVALATRHVWRKMRPNDEQGDDTTKPVEDSTKNVVENQVQSPSGDDTTKPAEDSTKNVVANQVQSPSVSSDTDFPKIPSNRSASGSSSATNRPLSHAEMHFNFEKYVPYENISFSGQLLGRGQFGQVELVEVNMNDASVKCAAKMIRVWSDTVRKCFMCHGDIGRGTDEDERGLFEELQMLYRIPHHRNVVSLLGASMETDKPLYVLVEYCSNGSLLKYLQNHNFKVKYVNLSTSSTLDLRWKLKIALGICSGMIFLSQHQIIHRDLAARNILLDGNEVAKISDFGMAKDVYLRGLYVKNTPGFLPVRWMAIEAIESSIYTMKSDMWSFGVLLWELYTNGQTPHAQIMDGKKILKCLLDGYRMDQPEHCPDVVYNLMKRCWSRNPDHRPGFMQAKRELTSMHEKEGRKESVASRKTECSEASSVFNEDDGEVCDQNNELGIINNGRTQSNEDIELKVLDAAPKVHDTHF